MKSAASSSSAGSMMPKITMKYVDVSWVSMSDPNMRSQGRLPPWVGGLIALHHSGPQFVIVLACLAGLAH
jgi:hypothetical protein